MGDPNYKIYWLISAPHCDMAKPVKQCIDGKTGYVCRHDLTADGLEAEIVGPPLSSIDKSRIIEKMTWNKNAVSAQKRNEQPALSNDDDSPFKPGTKKLRKGWHYSAGSKKNRKIINSKTKEVYIGK